VQGRSNLASAPVSLSVDDIPNCSAVDRLTLEKVSDDNVNIAELAAVIEENPSLSGLITGLANSAFHASPRPVVRVHDAIIKVLGIRVVRSIAFSVIIGRSMDPSECPGFDPTVYGSDAISLARTAKKQRWGSATIRTAFT
jgi:HD-like signal output (HDOD) protein